MKQRPNILVFMTDQQRACSVLPDDPYKAKTPALDAFRQDSVTFQKAYCPSPHCCPSRATFFTGLMPSEHGVWNNVSVANALSRGLKEGVRPWSMDLADAGYQLHFAGKWHVSNYQQPRDFGWQHVFPESMCHGEGLTLEEQERTARDRDIETLRACAGWEPSGPRRPGEIRRHGTTPYVHYGTIDEPLLAGYFKDGEDDNPFGDRSVVDAALARLKQSDGPNPWCMFVGTLGPHDPYIPPKRFLDMYADARFPLPATFDDPMADKPALYRRTRKGFEQLTREEHQQAIRHYLAFCSYEDWLFGRLVDALKQRGEYDSTAIVFLSDHGDYMGDHGLWCKGLPSFLSAYHIPAIIKAPGAGKDVVCDEFVSLADFGPTLLELAQTRSRVSFAGRSLVPLLRGDRPDDWRDAVFFQTNGNETYGIQRSILTEKWRFVYNGFDYDELYDVGTDPGQMRNLAGLDEYKPVVREMYRRIWSYGMDHSEPLVNNYIMTALAEFGPGMVLGEES
jgi:arylsulfatase A-like enzyme